MLRTLFALALGIAVTVQGAPEPEALAKLEGWEGIYDTKVACLESFSGDDLCKKVAEMVDFSTVVLTSNTTYLMMSKAGNDWPFYGFRVALEPGGDSVSGTTPSNAAIEIRMARNAENGQLSGNIRDPRFPTDLKIIATPRKLAVKIPFSRLYGHRMAGEPLSVDEVIGNYTGKAYGADARVILKESALSTEARLLSASFIRQKDQSIELFTEITLDSVRGLVSLVQYDAGLPNRKWVLVYRRDDITFQPSLLGTAVNLRRGIAYDVAVDKDGSPGDPQN